MFNLTKTLVATLALAGLGASTPVSLDKRQPGRVVKAGEPVVIDPNGQYIRVSHMNDGTLIGGYAAKEGDTKIMRVIHSSDGAKSWEHIGEVFRGPVAKHDMDNAFPIQLPGGRLLYAYRNHDRTGADLHYTYFRISVSYSDDNGRNWKYLSTVEEHVPKGVNGLWEPFLRFARDGTLQCYYSAENAANDQDNFMKHSNDGGKTWSNWVPVSGGDRVSRDGMVGVAPIDDNGNLIAVFEHTTSGIFNVDYVISHDDGYTWGERGSLYTAANGKLSGAPQVYNVGGTLVASFMTNEDYDKGNNNGYNFGQMKVVTSTNGGKSWSGSVVTGEAEAHWPGIFNLDSTHFLALYAREGVGAVSQLYELVN
ncbi:bnr asp-box repeat domain protein [Colletotrichum karsti]|uniref:Bnr asp-box repeat domain protein n=1 Tax=Colletotrichum karsti TaxID=1095194 RepID=A0A9P6I5A8_9PEZI|nr:bnr asp-box repeat domain protein [Colletotrichum karsti]KAF9876514.1 bnr asp-box repeat domain protein [Colletotrichum karsti]